MELQLTRKVFTPESTIGTLKVGDIEVFTLEDAKRDIKVYGKTCISVGTYQIKTRNEGGKHHKYSDRFAVHEGMSWLQDVPDFTWVYIHVGNFPKDTLGCILVGETKAVDSIGRSVAAYTKIYPLILAAIQNEGCSIVIEE